MEAVTSNLELLQRQQRLMSTNVSAIMTELNLLEDDTPLLQQPIAPVDLTGDTQSQMPIGFVPDLSQVTDQNNQSQLQR